MRGISNVVSALVASTVIAVGLCLVAVVAMRAAITMGELVRVWGEVSAPSHLSFSVVDSVCGEGSSIRVRVYTVGRDGQLMLIGSNGSVVFSSGENVELPCDGNVSLLVRGRTGVWKVYRLEHDFGDVGCWGSRFNGRILLECLERKRHGNASLTSSSDGYGSGGALVVSNVMQNHFYDARTGEDMGPIVLLGTGSCGGKPEDTRSVGEGSARALWTDSGVLLVQCEGKGCYDDWASGEAELPVNLTVPDLTLAVYAAPDNEYYDELELVITVDGKVVYRSYRSKKLWHNVFHLHLANHTSVHYVGVGFLVSYVPEDTTVGQFDWTVWVQGGFPVRLSTGLYPPSCPETPYTGVYSPGRCVVVLGVQGGEIVEVETGKGYVPVWKPVDKLVVIPCEG